MRRDLVEREDTYGAGAARAGVAVAGAAVAVAGRHFEVEFWLVGWLDWFGLVVAG